MTNGIAKFLEATRAALLVLGGSSKAESRALPKSEQTGLIFDGLLIVLAQCFGIVGISAALLLIDIPIHVALPFALLAAATFMFLDRQFLASDLEHRGMQRISAGEGGGPRGRRLRDTLAHTLPRIGIASVSAALVSMMLFLAVFAKDVAVEMKVEHDAVNAPILEEAQKRVDADIEAQRNRATDLRNHVAQIEAEMHAALSPAANDGLAARRALIETEHGADAERLRSLEEKEREARDNMAAELRGQWLNEQSTGQRGPGDSYFFHRSIAERTASEIVALRKRMAEQQRAMTSLASDLEQSRESAAKAQSERRGPLARTLHEARQELTGATSALAAAEANRQSAIAAHAAATPGYKPVGEGLIAQLVALERITDRSALAQTSRTLLGCFLFLIEIAPILRRLAAPPHSMSGVLRIADYEARQWRLLAKFYRSVDAARDAEEKTQRKEIRRKIRMERERQTLQQEQMTGAWFAQMAGRFGSALNPKKWRHDDETQH